MNGSIRLALGLMFVAAAIGCQGAPQSSGTGHLIEPGHAMDLGYRLGFAVDLGVPPGHKIDHLVNFDGTLVVVESPANLITAVSLHDGTILWTQKVPGMQRLHRPQPFANQLLINSAMHLYRIRLSDGEIEQRQPLPASVSHGPAIYDDVAIFGGDDGVVYAYDVARAATLWRKNMSARIVAAPIVASNQVFVTDANGLCRMFSAMSGEYLWRSRTFGPIWARPALDRSNVFVTCDDAWIYAFSRDELGITNWRYPAGRPLRQPPVVIDDLVFVNISGKGLHAIEAGDGTLRWRLTSEARPVTRIGDRVLIDNTHELLVVDARYGKSLKVAPTHTLQAVIRVDDDHLLLISPQGRILRLDRSR